MEFSIQSQMFKVIKMQLIFSTTSNQNLLDSIKFVQIEIFFKFVLFIKDYY